MACMNLSKSFKSVLKKDRRPLFILATDSGFHPSRLSRLLHGEEIKRPHDVRFRLLAELIRFDGPIFEEGKTS